MDILQGGPIYMPKVTRVEVIDCQCSEQVLFAFDDPTMAVAGSLNDDGRTLKLFLTDRKPQEETRK